MLWASLGARTCVARGLLPVEAGELCLHRAHAGCMATWSGHAIFLLPHFFQIQKVLSWGPSATVGCGWFGAGLSPVQGREALVFQVF